MAFPKKLPTARVLDQATAPRLRWGICGPGWIAERFVAALKANTQQEFWQFSQVIPAEQKRSPTRQTSKELWEPRYDGRP
jgi:hypothetical protein